MVDGEGDGGGAVLDAELAVDGREVGVDGARAEEEASGDVGVGQPLGDQPQHLRLAGR